MKMRRSIILGAVSFLLFFLAATYITYPLIFHFGDRVTGFGDELLIAWIQNWVIHALLTQPLALFNSNLYYPYHHTLAYTENFIVTSILAIPAKFIVGQPIATVNFTFWSSLILFGFSIYLLCFYLTRNFIVSLFSGVLVIFSPAVLDCYVHLQFLSMESVPLAILFFLHFMKTSKSRYLGFSLLFLLLQIYNSIMPGYFIIFAYTIIILFKLRIDKKKTVKLISVKNILLCTVFLLSLSFIAYPYISVIQQFHFSRDIRDAVHFALQPEDFVYPGGATRLQGVLMRTIPTNQYSENNEFHAGYLGVIFTMLVLVAIWYGIRNFKRKDTMLKIFLVIALVAIITSLGPVLHLNRHTVHIPFLIPLPYALFYYILPGFKGFRDAARWNMLFIISMSAVIALMLNNLLAKYSLKKKAIIYVLLFLGVIVEFNPFQFQPLAPFNEIPKVYSWLATTTKDTKIIEMPIYNWNMFPFSGNEIVRDYYSIADFRKTVNGASGFSPPPWQVLVTDLTYNFPSKSTIKELKSININYVIIHTDEYDACSKTKVCGHKGSRNGKEIIKLIQESESFKLVKQFKDTYVYKFQ